MANGTVALESGSALTNGSLLQTLQNLLGGTVDVNKTGTTTSQQNSTQNQSGSQTTTGQTTGTNNQSTTGSTTTGQTTNQSGSTTGSQSGTATGSQTTNQSGTQQQSTQNTADVAALQQILAQQQAGVTPEMLQAIFTKGSQQVPGLVQTMANAVGARQSNNAPLAAALGTLGTDMAGQVAQLQLAQQSAAAETAAKIAQLTSGQTTTGTTQQATTGNTQQSTQQSNQQSTQQTSQVDTVQQLLQQILGTTTQNQTGTTTSDQTTTNAQTGSTTENSNTQQDSQMNTGNIGNMLGALLGTGLLSSGLQGAGLGGLSGLLGSANSAAGSAGSAIAQLVKSLMGGSTGDSLNLGSWESLLGGGLNGLDLSGILGDGTQLQLDGSSLGDLLGGNFTLDGLLGNSIGIDLSNVFTPVTTGDTNWWDQPYDDLWPEP